MESSTEIHAQVCPRAPAAGTEGREGGRKRPVQVVAFLVCNRGMSLTLEHCQVIKLHVPNGLLLRLEVGTNGGEDEVTEEL